MLKEPGQDGKATDDDTNGDFGVIQESQYDHDVTDIPRFGNLERVVRPCNRGNTRPEQIYVLVGFYWHRDMTAKMINIDLWVKIPMMDID